MPELPEVETVKRTLQNKLAGLSFRGVQVFMPKVVRTHNPAGFSEAIAGKKILKIGRRGKYLLLRLNGDWSLVVHLRMTGRLYYCDPGAPLQRYTHVVFELDNGCQLRYSDLRQFGRIWLMSPGTLDKLPGYKDLGVEPLDEAFTRDYLKKELRRRRSRIKPLLLDQTFIAGLGNIYADEALHRAKINPERLATTLTPREVANLHRSIREVLTEGIEHRGTTMRDYIDGDGRPGQYQEMLRVYGREGKPCPACGRAVEKRKIAGRSSYFCPACQKNT
ncbi:MAG: DNA-formamidopyrimidine glycosylase [Firmicutes bacterium]|nr:DNA-formamidopyrimidine glycosylase [Bacillota bacterium]